MISPIFHGRVWRTGKGYHILWSGIADVNAFTTRIVRLLLVSMGGGGAAAGVYSVEVVFQKVILVALEA